MEANKEWKKSVGFPINYSPDNTDDDFDQEDVVMRVRHPRQSELMLADEGDGADADLLGTTPPRARVRANQHRKWAADAERVTPRAQSARDSRHDSASTERPRNRLSLKIQRARDRDDKQRAPLASLPSPVAVPTLVESCSRFMSLSSRLKSRAVAGGEGGGGGEPGENEEACVELRAHEAAPASRVSFHKTFSMLITMGNMDKSCRRTISREEQVWQNELKDLIWLELQARIAGRALADQDAFLCAQRDVVPAVLHNIRNYRFVNRDPCRPQPSEGTAAGAGTQLDDDGAAGCVALTCARCSQAVGRALREVGTLLDSYHNALALYPSSHAMTADHPLLATQLFKNRLKAMCLWYNMAMHMRLKLIAVRRMIRTMKDKEFRRETHAHRYASRQSFDSPRPCQVRFNVSATPSSSDTSSNSDASARAPQTDAPAGEAAARGELEGAQSDEEPARGAGAARTGVRGEGSRSEPCEGDEVDSSCDPNYDVGPAADETAPAPPALRPDSRYGTADTSASSESGYTSDAHEPADHVYDIGSLAEISELRLLNKAPVSIYRAYHHEILKTQGVRRCMLFVSKMRCDLLQKVFLTLERPHGARAGAGAGDEAGDEEHVFQDSGAGGGEPRRHQLQREHELRRFGCQSAECVAMRLPSYRGHFLLLGAVCMEAVHDYLALRLEDRPRSPSCLTVKQLIHELKEGLDIATEMRAAFARSIHAALAGQRAARPHRRDLLLVVRGFDRTVRTVLQQYLSYLRTMSEVEQLSRACLQAEWAFSARLAQRVFCAAQLAPRAFAEIACNQLDRVRKQFEQKFKQLGELEKNAVDPDKRHVYSVCRAVQAVYASEREHTLRAAHWARLLAARLARAPPPAYAQERERIFESLMRIRNLLVQQTKQILERSRLPDHAPDDISRDSLDALGARVRELMLQIYRLGFELHKELYRFAAAPRQLRQERGARRPASLPPAPRAPPPRRRRPETVLARAPADPATIHKELHRFVHDTARDGAGAGGGAGARARLARADSVLEDALEERLCDHMRAPPEQQSQSSIELFLSGDAGESEEGGEAEEEGEAEEGGEAEEAGDGGEAEADAAEEAGDGGEAEADAADAAVRMRATEHAWAAGAAHAVVEFAHCWMQFVVERCETGRGLRPRWASQGLEFLMLACDPCNTRHLSDAEFERLKARMDGCISHVVGARPATPRAADAAHAPDSLRRRPRLRSPHAKGTGETWGAREAREAGGAGGAGEGAPTPPTPPLEPEPLFDFPGVDYTEHARRVAAAAQRLDAGRERRRRAARAVGRVLDSAVHTYEPKLRQLTFKWQRGLKIGAGSFGKVYTVVNTETGQLLAMKEISLGVGDRRALQRAANELRVLEGVIHPHLVRYYGCELHREEMLIFMELCVEGSLEALVATAGALAEHAARRYTKQLLSALTELHARGIAHRDVKSGNIFLTNEGHCLKLGDFGCAVKIRADSTAAGELRGHVGTQAYMAPEVFMRPTGHGRAADIWSLGCVVTEMASGQRPFSEYDSNVQIMFVVGMGGRPAVPDTLSEEGRAFCRACLTHEPDSRPAAAQLADHHFLKLKADDDCECEPAFLIT